MNIKTLIYSENIELSLQLIGKAIELSSVSIVAITGENEDAQLLVKHGAQKVYLLRDKNLDSLKSGILKVVDKESPELIIIGSTKRGRELAPRIASVLKAGYSTDCFDLKTEADGLTVKRFVYGGSSIATEFIKGRIAVVTVPKGTFQKSEEQKTGEINELPMIPLVSRIKILETRSKKTNGVELETAKTIVSAGRGFKKREDLKMLEELAIELGAKMGCSRPISADLGWMDQWVGISGKKVAPRLYVACGVSGTIQHAAGIRESQIIVSINSDETAGIHEISDYSIVGDIYSVLPALTKALKERQ